MKAVMVAVPKYGACWNVYPQTGRIHTQAGIRW